MKSLLVLTLFGLCLAELKTYNEFRAIHPDRSVSDYALELGFNAFDQQFLKFKLDHSKSYETEGEEQNRQYNFLRTLQFIESHNELYKRGEATHEVGVTPFADMTQEEYLKTFTMPSPLALNITPAFEKFDPIEYENLPAHFDWRQSGKVTPVKNQGQCGSCWAFTTNAMIESGYLIHHNQHVLLSEQQLVDCTHTNCGGMYIDKSLDYVRAHGMMQQGEYPYVARAGACRDNPSHFHARISGYRTMGRAAGHGTASAAEIMSALKNNGPIGIMLNAAGDDFAHYRGGVLTTGASDWKAVHAVTIVGWGTENNTPYWIIKNSWGSGWGAEGGFLKLARGRDQRGCEQYLYYPTF